MRYQILNGDCIEMMRTLPDKSVNCCVTSPPYFGLRDYGCDGQIGLEETPEDFIKKLVDVFREVKRVLKDDGTLWVNIGDSYSRGDRGTVPPQKGSAASKNDDVKYNFKSASAMMGSHPEIKPKDLIGIPWMLAFALRADGWYLRQDIIWHKPNPMPESVTDRCTKSHEYIFLLTKSKEYYFNSEAIKEAVSNPYRKNYVSGSRSNGINIDRQDNDFSKRSEGRVYEKRNKRSVWSVSTKAYSEAHFATYPPELILPCVLAGCPEEGVVLDPFGGSGTTAQVAIENRREAILCELNPEYVKIIEKRLSTIQVNLI